MPSFGRGGSALGPPIRRKHLRPRQQRTYTNENASDSSEEQGSQFAPNQDASDAETSHDDDVDHPLRTKPKTLKHPAHTSQDQHPPHDQPTLENYHQLCLEWGQARADRILACIPNTTTRTSPTNLFESQSLQAQYNLDKTMLCIINNITCDTLDKALYVSPNS